MAASKGACLAFTEDLLGGPVNELESNVTTGASVVQAVGGNGDRVGLLFVNQGSNDAFIAVGPNPGATNGIRLTQAGGSASFNVRDDYTLPSRNWFVVSPAGASNVYVLEIVRFSQFKPVNPAGA